MVILSNFTYHSTNAQAEDTSLNLTHYIEELKFHFLSPDQETEFKLIMPKYIEVYGSITQCGECLYFGESCLTESRGIVLSI